VVRQLREGLLEVHGWDVGGAGALAGADPAWPAAVRAPRGRAQMRTDVGTLGRMRLARATIRLDRVLFEAGHGELTHPTRAQRPLKLKLRRAGRRWFSGQTKGRRPVRIVARRHSDRRVTLTLTSTRVYHTPQACHAVPASVALQSPPLWLHTGMVISHGRTRRRVTLSHHVRCRRDARGNVNRLEYVRYRHYRRRRGLAVTLRGPRIVRPGATVRYVARVHNRRRARRGANGRMVSSLWDVTLTDGRRTKRIRELRRGRTRTFAFTIRVPRNARTVRAPGTPRRRFCAVAVAGATAARPASDRACASVQVAPPPRVPG
jgi:hypothetical protein